MSDFRLSDRSIFSQTCESEYARDGDRTFKSSLRPDDESASPATGTSSISSAITDRRIVLAPLSVLFLPIQIFRQYFADLLMETVDVFAEQVDFRLG